MPSLCELLCKLTRCFRRKWNSTASETVMKWSSIFFFFFYFSNCCMEPWTVWYCGWQSCPWQRLVTGLSLRSFPTQAILSFCTISSNPSVCQQHRSCFHASGVRRAWCTDSTIGSLPGSPNTAVLEWASLRTKCTRFFHMSWSCSHWRDSCTREYALHAPGWDNTYVHL